MDNNMIINCAECGCEIELDMDLILSTCSLDEIVQIIRSTLCNECEDNRNPEF